MSRKSRMGRPPLPEGEAREIVFTLRLSGTEHEAVVQAANKRAFPRHSGRREADGCGAG